VQKTLLHGGPGAGLITKKCLMSDAMDLNAACLDEVMRNLSRKELDVLQKLLQRVREDFVPYGARAYGVCEENPCEE
jgi:hypothetical protein